jgi:cytochrome c oxidase assembly protein subunit 11
MNADDGKRLKKHDRDLVVAGVCGAVVGVMIAASYAAVPLYNWFCRTTGFGGTTQVSAAGSAPAQKLERTIKVRFDSNVGPGLPWKFEPEQTSIDVRIGEVVTVLYHVTNLSARETWATAAYNVAPLTVGAYFQKINCFCFTEQHLKPGEKQDLTVVFYVDPSLVKDADQNDLNTITLSYTFYPQKAPAPQQGVADGSDPKKSGRI